jgi:regulator of sigma E protease
VAVDRFSIGFGRRSPTGATRPASNGGSAGCPLGGYVRFAGDDNAASVPDQDDLEVLRAEI